MNINRLRDRHKKLVFPFAIVLLSCLKLFLFSPATAQSKDNSNQSTLPQAYLEAIEDAKVPEPNEIYRNLTAITWYNPKLVWNRDRVLVTLWTTWQGYAKSINKPMLLTRDTWVTAVPDLRDFCRNYRPNNQVSLSYRLNQVLGLPPDGNGINRNVVELWVEPRYLFRPSRDPEISDYEAELSFPISSWFDKVSNGYQDWFGVQFTSRFIPPRNEANTFVPYPWTQLGYTYDWGNQSDWKSLDANRPAHVGLSEFVIREWSLVSVHSVQSAENYCK